MHPTRNWWWMRRHNFIAVCVTLLGFTITDDDVTALDAGFSSMPEVSTTHCASMLPDGDNDKTSFDMQALHPINLYALGLAATKLKLATSRHVDTHADQGTPAAVPPADAPFVACESTVRFKVYGIEKEGSVRAVRDTECVCVCECDDGDTEEYTVSLAGVRPVIDLSGSSEAAPPPPRAPAAPEPEDGVSATRFKFPPSYCLTTEVLTNVSSKNKHAARELVQSIHACSQKLNPGAKAVSADFEFYPFIALCFFLSGLAIIPIIAFGHLAKCCATSMLKFYEKFFAAALLGATGITTNTPKSNKVFAGTHIRKTIKVLNQQQLALRISLAEKWLREEETWLDVAWRMELPDDDGDEGWHHETVLDYNCRPYVVAFTPQHIEMSAAFMAWSADQATNGCDVPAYNPSTQGSGSAGNGELRDGVADEHVRIFTLPYYEGNGDIGLRARCTKLGISMGVTAAGCHASKKLLREKVYAYYAIGGGALDGPVANHAAGIAAAEQVVSVGEGHRLPTLTSAQHKQLNHNARALNCFLFVEIVPWLLLVRLMHVREPDKNGGDVDDTHLWLLMVKFMLENVFLRTMPNYQRSMIYFVYFVALVQHHTCAVFRCLVFRHVRASLALSMFGDSHNCQPGDLHQETYNVQTVKRAACRNPSSFVMAQARCLAASLIRFRRHVGLQHKPARARSAAQTAKEAAEFGRVRAVARTVVTNVLGAEGSLDVAGHPGVKLQNVSQLWLRAQIARQNCRDACTVIVAGLHEKVSMSLRQPKYPPLAQLHVTQSARKQPTQAQVVATQQSRERIDALEREIAATKKVPLPMVELMFYPPSPKTGDGKGAMTIAMLSAFHAAQHTHALGGPARKAVNIFRHSAQMVDFVQAAAADTADRLHVLIDVMQYMQHHPKFRAGHAGTIKELARAIILLILGLYRIDDACVIFCMDVGRFMTNLREIQQTKRDKRQADSATDAANYAGCAPDTLLDKLGPWHQIWKSIAFRERVAQQIMHELKHADVEGGWALPGAGTNMTFAFVGGANAVCVTHRGNIRRVPFTEHTTVTTDELKRALADIPKQGEGERMIFSAAWRLLQLAHELESARSTRLRTSINRCAALPLLLDSYDTDALAGHLPGFMLNVKLQARKFGPVTDWAGRCLLRIHPKSPELLSSLGAKVAAESMASIAEQCTSAARSLGRPDGLMLEVLIDGETLLEAMEHDTRAPDFGEYGKRALMWPAVYAMSENDYLPAIKGGLSTQYLLDVARGPAFRAVVDGSGGAASLVTLAHKPGAFVATTADLGVNGLSLLLVEAVKQRSRTHRVLRLRYDEAGLREVPYTAVCAASVVAKEAIAAPSQLAILCRLSMARKVFSQHVNWMYDADPRPYRTNGHVTTAAEELTGSCYVAGDGGHIDFWYQVANAPTKVAAARLEDAAIREQLRRQFGSIVDMDTVPSGPWPLLAPFSVLRTALRNGGCMPREHVASNLVLPTFTQTSFDDFDSALRGAQNTYDKAEKIVEYTVAHLTMYNPRGNDHPRSNKVLSATLDQLSSNDGEWARAGWPNGQAGDVKLSEVLKGLKPDATRGACVQLLCVLVRHLFSASTVGGAAATQAQVATIAADAVPEGRADDRAGDNVDSDVELEDTDSDDDADADPDYEPEGMTVIDELLAACDALDTGPPAQRRRQH